MQISACEICLLSGCDPDPLASIPATSMQLFSDFSDLHTCSWLMPQSTEARLAACHQALADFKFGQQWEPLYFSHLVFLYETDKHDFDVYIY